MYLTIGAVTGVIFASISTALFLLYIGTLVWLFIQDKKLGATNSVCYSEFPAPLRIIADAFSIQPHEHPILVLVWGFSLCVALIVWLAWPVILAFGFVLLARTVVRTRKKFKAMHKQLSCCKACNNKA